MVISLYLVSVDCTQSKLLLCFIRFFEMIFMMKHVLSQRGSVCMRLALCSQWLCDFQEEHFRIWPTISQGQSISWIMYTLLCRGVSTCWPHVHMTQITVFEDSLIVPLKHKSNMDPSKSYSLWSWWTRLNIYSHASSSMTMICFELNANMLIFRWYVYHVHHLVLATFSN